MNRRRRSTRIRVWRPEYASKQAEYPDEDPSRRPDTMGLFEMATTRCSACKRTYCFRECPAVERSASEPRYSEEEKSLALLAWKDTIIKAVTKDLTITTDGKLPKGRIYLQDILKTIDY